MKELVTSSFLSRKAQNVKRIFSVAQERTNPVFIIVERDHSTQANKMSHMLDIVWGDTQNIQNRGPIGN